MLNLDPLLTPEARPPLPPKMLTPHDKVDPLHAGEGDSGIPEHSKTGAFKRINPIPMT